MVPRTLTGPRAPARAPPIDAIGSADREGSPTAMPEIEVDGFFSVPIEARGGSAFIGGARLTAEGKPLSLTRVPDGEVG